FFFFSQQVTNWQATLPTARFVSTAHSPVVAAVRQQHNRARTLSARATTTCVGTSIAFVLKITGDIDDDTCVATRGIIGGVLLSWCIIVTCSIFTEQRQQDGNSPPPAPITLSPNSAANGVSCGDNNACSLLSGAACWNTRKKTSRDRQCSGRKY
ncbi:unnamed protein product, partial [Pylaiella littoralis]